jgi:hypothetical protein
MSPGSIPVAAVGRQRDAGVLQQGFQPQYVGTGPRLGLLDLPAGDINAPLEGGDDLFVDVDDGFQTDIVVVRPADAGQGSELPPDQGERLDINRPVRHVDIERSLDARDDLLIQLQHEVALRSCPRANRVLVVEEPGIRVETRLDAQAPRCFDIPRRFAQ